jgi:hypothetical protein
LDVSLKSSLGLIDVEPPNDASELFLTSLDISGDVGAIDVTLPDHGAFTVNIEAGIGGVVLEVPSSLAAHVEAEGGLSEIEVEHDSLIQDAEDDKVWETEDYADAEEKVDITIEAGVGHVSIKD